MVMGDPTQIHQVLMNLCTNATHAMREKGGALEVGLEDVDLDADAPVQYPDLKPGPHVRLTVSDTGHGLDPAVMERIFDPYFTTKDKGVGTGLGLAVVHGIVKSHGGTITVYSEVGKGTTFHVLFPRIESVDAEETEVLEPLPKGDERILFVDDEEALVKIGQQMLERLAYEVVPRTSSIEALEAFRAQPDKFDLVITDQTMPNMTGEMLAKELMGIRPDIPIILCTGYSELISKERAKAMGIREYVMKPLVIRELATTIRKVLDKD
jgi:CheY-like chemotaxis protein